MARRLHDVTIEDRGADEEAARDGVFATPDDLGSGTSGPPFLLCGGCPNAISGGLAPGSRLSSKCHAPRELHRFVRQPHA